MAYDTKSYELAELFLSDESGLDTEANRHRLAQIIQSAIEDDIADMRRNYEPPDPMRGVEFPFAENH